MATATPPTASAAAAAATLDQPPPSADRSFFGHPRGLATLFSTEMWERFSFYGLRPLLVLFMSAALADGGFGFDRTTASSIVGIYAASVYLASLPGGWIADRLLGLRRAILYGAALISLGHLAIGVSGAVGGKLAFFVGLILIVLGTGLLKPNISAIVGDLYPEGGARRDAGFSLFAIGMRHQKLRAEIRKTLARAPAAAALAPLTQALEQMAILGFDTPDEMAVAHLAMGRRMLEKRASMLPKSFAGKLGKAEDVPDALAMSYATTSIDHFLSRPALLPDLLLMLPWVARAEAEDLYLPRSLIDAERVPWHPQRTLRLLRGPAAVEKLPSPKPEGPSRSGPCPCGSGKKYKRCCGDQRSP